MGTIRKISSLLMAVIIALSCPALLVASAANAQSISPSPSPQSQVFDYRLPSGYTVLYEIVSYPTGYLIGLQVMDNPPIDINFHERLPNGTEIEVTQHIAYGMTIGSIGYPTNITFTQLSSEPTSSPTNTPTPTGINQAIPKPSLPECTARYFDSSYDVAPVYGIDPNTDERVIKQAGYHVDNRSIQFTIRNQPFTPFTEPLSGRTIDLFYNIKYRFVEAEWASMFGGDRQIYGGSSGDLNFDPYLKYGYPIQNYTGQYTIITYTLPPEAPQGGQMQFQIQALEGYTNSTQIGESHIFLAFVNYSFFGEKSGWSSIQTINLVDGSVSVVASPNPTVTLNPTEIITDAPNNSILGNQPLSNMLLIVVVAVLGLAVASLLVYVRKIKKQPEK